MSTITNNDPLNPSSSINNDQQQSDDEDLFVSTYEKQPSQQKTITNVANNNNEKNILAEDDDDDLVDVNVNDDVTNNESNEEIKPVVEPTSSTLESSGPTPPPRKQSLSQTITPQTNSISKLESEMNTIDLNDDNDNDMDDHSNTNNDDGHKTEINGEQFPVKENKESSSTIEKLDQKTNNIEQLSSGVASGGTGPGPIENIVTNNTSATATDEDVNSESKQQQQKQQPPVQSNTASQISITVSDPQKIGEGMGSYMVYQVSTRTTLPYFRRQSMSVNRRFSDFLGLHERLLLKHGPSGRIIPPPPAKSAFGTAKVKMAKDDTLQSLDFLSKRRAALERYLQRNAEHPNLCSDPDFREFLELDTDLPRSTSTSALSGANVKRFFSLVGDTVNKMTFRMEESDPNLRHSFEEIKWFESKQQQIDILETQLKKLHQSVETLITHRKELTTSLGILSKSTALIGHDETNVSLSCALSHLAATHEKVEKIYDQQANNDFLYLSELLRDYLAMIGAVKEAFHERVKCYQNLTNLEQTLNRKREAKTKMELAMKNVHPIDDEINDLQDKVEKSKQDFENISETIKQEFQRFDINRIKDFKNNFMKYMQSLLETQEALIESWETFLPEAKSISA